MDRGMIPLINVVFLMLAFLVLAGQIEVHHRKLVVPKSTSVVERGDSRQTLTIFADGSLEYEGAEIQIEALPQVLESVVLPESAEARATVLVVADAQLLVSDLQNVLNELQELGIRNGKSGDTAYVRATPPRSRDDQTDALVCSDFWGDRCPLGCFWFPF